MARGRTARKRRVANRAAARRVEQLGVDKAQAPDPLIATLEARAEARAARAGELAASGSTSLSLGERTAKWDGAAADKSVREWAGAEDAPNAKYGQAFFFKDGDGKSFGDYKLGFAEPVDGKLQANWGGIVAVAGALSGARGGVKGLTPADTASIKGKVEGYYAKAAKQYDDDSIEVPWKKSDQKVAASLAEAEVGSADEGLLLLTAMKWEEQLATMPACANCDHAYTAHLGTAGPCTAEDCGCEGYVGVDDGDGDEASHGGPNTAEIFVKVRPDLTGFEEEFRERLIEMNPELADVLATVNLGFETIALPDQHQPGERLPEPHATPEPPEPVASGDDGVSLAWSSILAPEGKLTSDGRAFAPGSIKWRDLPLTLMAMIETSEGGHIGAQVAGRIDEIWRDSEAGLIRGKGEFDPGEYGTEIARLVDDKTLRGVSVDLAIAKYVTGPKADFFDEDGNWAPKDQAAVDDETPTLLDLYADDVIAVVLEAEIGMTTVCPFPAFAEAQIAIGDSLVAGANPAFWTVTQDGGFVVTASAAMEEDCGCTDQITASAAGLAPERPPVDWFTDPEFEGETAITVDDDGRIFGHAAVWGVCHIGLPGQCRTAPHSNTDYALFHLGEVLCEDGERVAVGQITLDTGHAQRDANGAAAAAHYDDTGLAVADVRVGEDEFGIWVAGALRPDVPEEKARVLRGSKLSGDWRKKDGNLELVALLCVNVPGFPVPRARAYSESVDGLEPEVMTLVAAGIPVFESEIGPDEHERFEALRLAAEFAALEAA